MQTLFGDLSNVFQQLRRRYSPRLAAYMRVAYKTPRRVVLVTTKHGQAENVWPMDWHMPLSFDPPQYGIAINSESYGAELIRKSGVFIVNFVSHDWEETILFCGRASGRNVNKIQEAGLDTEPGRYVAAPRLCGAVGHIECDVIHEIATGDHILFVGKVLDAHEHGAATELYHETL